MYEEEEGNMAAIFFLTSFLWPDRDRETENMKPAVYTHILNKSV